MTIKRCGHIDIYIPNNHTNINEKKGLFILLNPRFNMQKFLPEILSAQFLRTPLIDLAEIWQGYVTKLV